MKTFDDFSEIFSNLQINLNFVWISNFCRNLFSSTDDELNGNADESNADAADNEFRGGVQRPAREPKHDTADIVAVELKTAHVHVGRALADVAVHVCCATAC